MFNNFNLNGCLFYIDGRPIENVTSYSHFGHFINCHIDEKENVLQRRCNFTGQANNFCSRHWMCTIKIKLFKSYCSSNYGSELWSLEEDALQWANFCCKWRTALRRLLN